MAALIESLEAKRTIPQIEIAAGDDLVALIFRHLHPLSAADQQALRESSGNATTSASTCNRGGIDSVSAFVAARCAPELSLAGL